MHLPHAPRTRAAREDGPPRFARERGQPALVAAATTTPTAPRVDEEQDGDHDRGDQDARENQPARATPGANPALSLLLMKRGHEDHLLLLCIQRAYGVLRL